MRRSGTGLYRIIVAGALVACTTTTGPVAETPAPTTVPEASETVSAADAEGGTLRYSLTANPASIDPRFVADEEGLVVVDALFDSLVAMGADLVTVEPAAATSWDVTPDRRTYTFTLDTEATYHDGTPVVAGDFVRSFRRIVDREATPASFLFYQLAPVVGYEQALAGESALRGVTAPDEHTLRIRLRRADEEFLQVLTHPSLAPIPAGADQDPDGFASHPVGNGPFAMAEPWQPNQFIRVLANPDHASPPRLDEVVFQIYAGDTTRQQQYDDFRGGRVDVAEVPPDAVQDAITAYGQSADGYRGTGVLEGVTGTVYYYGFNTELAPFDDPTVRRAVSLLIDRDRIVDEVLRGVRAPADTLLPPSLPAGQARRCEACRYDPDRARELLGLVPSDTATTSELPSDRTAPPSEPDQEPTGPDQGPTGPTQTPTSSPPPADGLVEGPLEIVYNRGTTNELIAELVAADITTALGVTVTTRAVRLSELVGELREGQIGIFRLGWTVDHPGAGALLQPLFRSDQIGADNVTRFADADVDALLDQARAAVDPAERRALYVAAEERILELMPVAPVFFYRHMRIVDEDILGLRIGPLGDVNLDEIVKRVSS